MIDNKLYSLIAVYECGSFQGAAKKLSLTQPAVSQHIKALEDELNTKIFVRNKGNLTVTKQGEQVIRCAQKMIGLFSLLKQELADNHTNVEHLKIGITHTAESNPIAESLAKYCSENEGISIKIITDTINNLYIMLRTYELDMAIVEGRREEENISFLLLDTDYLVLAMSPSHPLADRSTVSLNELKKERLILRLPDSGTRNLFVAHLESHNMDINEFNVILEIDNVATIKDLIRRGFGVSILPKSVCLNEIRKKKITILPVENLSMMREMNIAYQSDFSHPEILQGIVKAYNDTLWKYKK